MDKTALFNRAREAILYKGDFKNVQAAVEADKGILAMQQSETFAYPPETRAEDVRKFGPSTNRANLIHLAIIAGRSQGEVPVFRQNISGYSPKR